MERDGLQGLGLRLEESDEMDLKERRWKIVDWIGLICLGIDRSGGLL